LISVIVLNWNGLHHLQGCFSSLMSQSFQDFEAILVDNHSSDGSVAWMRERFPTVRIIELDANAGFCSGNNAGIRAASGEYVALLNNDVQVDKHWLAELYKAIEEHPEAGFCSSKIKDFSRHDLLDSTGDFLYSTGFPGKRGHLQRDEGQYDRQEYVFSACAAAALYRRSMLDEIGLLDPDFYMMAEDLDLGFRAQLYGHKCMYVPSAVIYHKVGASIGTRSATWLYYSHRNVPWMIVKNMPAPLLVRYMPGMLLANAVSFAVNVPRGLGGTVLRAKADMVRGLPRMWGKRKAIQTHRRVSLDYISQMIAPGWFARKTRPGMMV